MTEYKITKDIISTDDSGINEYEYTVWEIDGFDETIMCKTIAEIPYYPNLIVKGLEKLESEYSFLMNEMINVRSKNSVYIEIGKWTYYFDNSIEDEPLAKKWLTSGKGNVIVIDLEKKSHEL